MVNERVIQILEDLLRGCDLEFSGNWEEHLSLVEFMYNNNYQTTIGMAPFKLFRAESIAHPCVWKKLGTESCMGQN